MREEVFRTVSNVVREDKRVILMLVDIGVMGFRKLLEEVPDRAKNLGILEDGMISAAAGMAIKEMIPIVYGISPFIVDRALEQIKIDFAFQNLGGNFMTTGAAYDFSKAGYTHFCPEDIGILKMIPGMEFVAPGSSKEFTSLFRQTYANGRPTYFRLSDFENSKAQIVEFGKANVIKKGRQATVIAVSTMLDKVMQACEGKDVTILYYTTLEPFDQVTLRENMGSSKILLCEPSYEGGLVYDIMKICAGTNVVLDFVGIPREIIRVGGTKEEKDLFYNLTVNNINEKLERLIEK